jgi:protein involved in polysaccharide export with SLBB domain
VISVLEPEITTVIEKQNRSWVSLSVRGCLFGCALLAAVLSGCATATPKWSEMPLPPVAADAAAAPEPAPEVQVVLQPYDTVRIKFLYWPELDDEQMIRPDGKISLLMVGEVEAQNRTPEDLQKELIKLYESKVNEPEINVVVTSLANSRVYIGGEVATPGLILIQGRLTVLGAVMQAGGFIESSAKKNSVVVVRQQGGKQFARTVDLKNALSGTESEPFYLQPYDIVWVPRTTITHVNEFVAQYIDGVIPKHVTASVGLYNFQQSSIPSTKMPVSITLPGGAK